MKKIFLGLLLFVNTISHAQKLENKVISEPKFQIGLHYVGNIRNNNVISDGFNGVVGISGNYAFYQDKLIALSGGINLDYLQSRDYFYPNDILIFNPNTSIEIDIFNGKLSPFLSIGYAFFSNKFEFETSSFDPFDPAFYQKKRKVNFNGITINPGIKFNISELFFLEGNYKYFPVNSTDFNEKLNVHSINFGLGIKF